MSELLQSGLHPDADQLSAFAEHALPDQLRRETLAHLSTCADCRNIVALALPPAEEELPQVAAAPRPWFAGWRLAWLAPAVAAVVVTAVLLHKPPASTGGSINEEAKLNLPPAPPSPAPVAVERPKPFPAAKQAGDKSAAEIPRPQAKLPAVARAQAAAPASGGLASAFGAVPQREASPPSPLVSSNSAAPEPLPPATTAEAGRSNGLALAPRMAMRRSLSPPPAATSEAVAKATQPVLTLDAQQVQSVAAESATLEPLDSIVSQHPLPSHLPAVSISSSSRATLALDTKHHLFFTEDAGAHWQPVKAPWHGKAVLVALAYPGSEPRAPATAAAGVVNGKAYAVDAAPQAKESNAAVPAPAPAAAASLSGTVTDATGATIPRATIILTSNTSATSRTVVADASGHFEADNLAPGAYQLVASSAGFDRLTLPVLLQASQRASADLKLNVGTATETVEVSSSDMAPYATLKKKSRLTGLLPVFEITTDRGDRWVSPDGRRWVKK